ncbi:GtrA family protein [Streptomyces sp. GbtcB6]|uniref:GtrA family protein n=1 Tax=Streptomyces sp. GbtcB6 TaxID=2824751 RepID=UPI0020C69FB7|nr:GtrA family protein [Streptomyces sp. GbtcB6]
MKSPFASEPETARETRCGTRVTPRGTATDRNSTRRSPAVPGPTTAFARFVLYGGGVGVASSAAVSLCAALMPWTVANALMTAASTALCTELHARFTFGAGRRAGWRRHWQSAGSAAAAYAITCAAMAVLHMVRPSPGILSEQIVYLSATGLAGTGRFLVLRLFVFAERGRAVEKDKNGKPNRHEPGTRRLTARHDNKAQVSDLGLTHGIVGRACSHLC